jgi:hypothetical protein
MTRGSPEWRRSRSYILLLYKSHKTRTTCRIYMSKNKMQERSTKMPHFWFHILFLDPYLCTPNTLYGSMFSYTLRPHWRRVCCSVVSVRRMMVPGRSTNTTQSHSRNIFPCWKPLKYYGVYRAVVLIGCLCLCPCIFARLWFSC